MFAVKITSSVAAIIFLLVLAGISREVVQNSPTRSSSVEGSAQDPYICASKIVAQPWFGRHEVYGIFIVPLRYRSGRTYRGKLSVNGYQTELLPDGQLLSRRDDDVVAGEKSYVLRGHIPTRIALWFVFTGQFGDLLIPCNWRLELVGRPSPLKYESQQMSSVAPFMINSC